MNTREQEGGVPARVIRVAHLDTGRTWRGGQAQVARLIAGLEDCGCESVLLAPPGPLLERVRSAGGEVHAWRARGDLDWIARGRALAAIRDVRPLLLHAHDARAHAVAAWVGERLGLPVVVTRRSLGDPNPSWWTRRKYARGVDRYLCVSQAVVAWLRAAGVPEQRLTRVPSGVDLVALERVRRLDAGPRLRERLGLEGDVPIVGTVAALTAEKGVSAFVRAAGRVRARHPDARWVWIGEGPKRAELVRAAHAAGVSDRIVAFGFHENASELARDFTLFVSASEREGLGTSVLEAQALGVPVIATRSGGVEELIEDGVSGRLVLPEALGDAVAAALDDPQRASGWAQEARIRVAGYGVEAMVDATLVAYGETLKQRAVTAEGLGTAGGRPSRRRN